MNAEAEAINLLEELGINKLPIIPKELCKRLDIVYTEDPLNSIDGMLILKPNHGALISVNSLITDEGRKNFTCAHELGHFCLDSHTQSSFICTRDSIESYKNHIKDIEIRANKFAAELLMPTPIYQKLVNSFDPSWDYIEELSIMSQTSLLSTVIKFIDLTEHACALIVIEKDKISWFRKSKAFLAFIEMKNRFLSKNTVAYSITQNIPPPEGFETVKAVNWVSGHGVKPHTEILEWSLPMNSYGQILTLLVDEIGIEGWGKDEYSDDDDGVEWEPPTFHKSKRK